MDQSEHFYCFCRNQSETILLQSSPELLISLLNMPVEIDVTVRKLRAIDAQPVKLKISSSKFVPLQIVLVILLDDVFIRQYVRSTEKTTHLCVLKIVVKILENCKTLYSAVRWRLIAFDKFTILKGRSLYEVPGNCRPTPPLSQHFALSEK